MTLKDLIESKKETTHERVQKMFSKTNGGKGLKISCGNPEENEKKYKTYRRYHKAIVKKFGKSFNDFSDKEKAALDAGWKSAYEKGED